MWAKLQHILFQVSMNNYKKQKMCNNFQRPYSLRPLHQKKALEKCLKIIENAFSFT